MSHMKAEFLGDDQVELTHELTRSKINTDLPPDNGGKGRTFSPTDLLASSLCSCILTIMGKMGQRDGVDLKGTQIDFKKEMSSSPRRIAKISGEICFPKHVSDVQKEKYLAAIKACPVHESLHPDVIIDFRLS